MRSRCSLAHSRHPDTRDTASSHPAVPAALSPLNRGTFPLSLLLARRRIPLSAAACDSLSDVPHIQCTRAPKSTACQSRPLQPSSSPSSSIWGHSSVQSVWEVPVWEGWRDGREPTQCTLLLLLPPPALPPPLDTSSRDCSFHGVFHFSPCQHKLRHARDSRSMHARADEYRSRHLAAAFSSGAPYRQQPSSNCHLVINLLIAVVASLSLTLSVQPTQQPLAILASVSRLPPCLASQHWYTELHVS